MDNKSIATSATSATSASSDDYNSPTSGSELLEDRSQRIQKATTKLCTDINKIHDDDHPHQLKAGEHVLANVKTPVNPQAEAAKVHANPADGESPQTTAGGLKRSKLPGNESFPMGGY